MTINSIVAMGVFDPVRGIFSADSPTHHECRKCGCSLETHLDECPECGSPEIASYQF
jgi:ribosomal protein L37E